MILTAFRKALLAALKRHFPHSKISVEERRGLILTCKAELNDETFIAVYFNALTGKTSYALVQRGQRVAGYDNYKFWHYHPLAATTQHVPCAEPTPEDALAELALVSAKL